jgi:hypothetical protein
LGKVLAGPLQVRESFPLTNLACQRLFFARGEKKEKVASILLVSLPVSLADITNQSQHSFLMHPEAT